MGTLIKKVSADLSYLRLETLKSEITFSGFPKKACQGCHISEGARTILTKNIFLKSWHFCDSCHASAFLAIPCVISRLGVKCLWQPSFAFVYHMWMMDKLLKIRLRVQRELLFVHNFLKRTPWRTDPLLLQRRSVRPTMNNVAFTELPLTAQCRRRAVLRSLSIRPHCDGGCTAAAAAAVIPWQLPWHSPKRFARWRALSSFLPSFFPSFRTFFPLFCSILPSFLLPSACLFPSSSPRSRDEAEVRSQSNTISVAKYVPPVRSQQSLVRTQNTFEPWLKYVI